MCYPINASINSSVLSYSEFHGHGSGRGKLDVRGHTVPLDGECWTYEVFRGHFGQVLNDQGIVEACEDAGCLEPNLRLNNLNPKPEI